MAQSTEGTDLETTWKASSARVFCGVDLWLDGYWNSIGDVVSVSINSKLLDPVYGLPLMGKVPPATCRITLDNSENTYSPNNNASIPDGFYQVPIRIYAGYYSAGGSQEFLMQFVGYITDAQEQETPSGKEVRLRGEDVLNVVREYQASTALVTDKRPDELINAYFDIPTDPTITHNEDFGLSMIPYAGMDNETILDECQEIAASDGGWIRATKEGTVVFERMTHWLESTPNTDHTTSVVTLSTGEAFWMSDVISYNDAFTKVEVLWTPWTESLATKVVHKAFGPIELKPNEVKTMVMTFDYLVRGDTIIPPVAKTDYSVVTASMVATTASVSINSISCRQAEVTFTNNNTNQVVYVLDFQIRGCPLLGRNMHKVSKEHSAGILAGAREFRHPDSFYIQNETQAERLASFLRDLLQRPRRLLEWRGPACPYLELGDLVHVDHKTATHNPDINVDGYVVGMNQTYSAGSLYEQELTILPIANLWPADTFFELGKSSYANTGSDSLFY